MTNSNIKILEQIKEQMIIALAKVITKELVWRTEYDPTLYTIRLTCHLPKQVYVTQFLPVEMTSTEAFKLVFKT